MLLVGVVLKVQLLLELKSFHTWSLCWRAGLCEASPPSLIVTRMTLLSTKRVLCPGVHIIQFEPLLDA